jgi:hypothetical protein
MAVGPVTPVEVSVEMLAGELEWVVAEGARSCHRFHRCCLIGTDSQGPRIRSSQYPMDRYASDGTHFGGHLPLVPAAEVVLCLLGLGIIQQLLPPSADPCADCSYSLLSPEPSSCV